ncbi:hypothetical protein [Saccharothrix saharensis]|uniref:hypothetical protein n=1 Tax=Saccharothrix saharensis TaxID=571190 RepID=UPI0011544AE1|nr:hypothetical protein [Saccharothrix saharensis]
MGVLVTFLPNPASQPVFVGAAGGLWGVFAAVVAGRFAPSTRIAASAAVGLQAGLLVALGLLTSVLRALPEFLVVSVPQSLVVVAAAAVAGLSRTGSRLAPVRAGLAVGLLGGVVLLLWRLGHTGRAVLVVGAVLGAVAAVMTARRAWHASVIVPSAAVVALAAAPVYGLVPAAFRALFPVLAG